MTTTATYTIEQIAQGLVDLCSQQNYVQAVEKYYADDVQTLEPEAMPEMPNPLVGKEAVLKANQWWVENNEVHRQELSEPLIGDTQFALKMTIDGVSKMSNTNYTMSEMILYTVKDGLISRVEFYYHKGA